GATGSAPQEPLAFQIVPRDQIGRRFLAGRTMDQRIHRAVRLIEDSLAEHIGLNDIAATVGLSRAQFNRLFVLGTGETPSDYLRRIRLDAAAARLRWTRQSVGAAAMDVGYDSQPSFTQA